MSETFRDLLRRIEKVGLNSGLTTWIRLRDLRNRVVHDYLPDRELFLSLPEARVVLDEWRMDYSHRRPHGGPKWLTAAAFASGLDDTASGVVPAVPRGVPPVGATPLPATTPRGRFPNSLTSIGTKTGKWSPSATAARPTIRTACRSSRAGGGSMSPDFFGATADDPIPLEAGLSACGVRSPWPARPTRTRDARAGCRRTLRVRHPSPPASAVGARLAIGFSGPRHRETEPVSDFKWAKRSDTSCGGIDSSSPSGMIETPVKSAWATSRPAIRMSAVFGWRITIAVASRETSRPCTIRPSLVTTRKLR
ncbi:hypothetical protein EBR04_01760 [bacterium]|nr:hypothetical protein [bacterium]